MSDYENRPIEADKQFRLLRFLVATSKKKDWCRDMKQSSERSHLQLIRLIEFVRLYPIPGINFNF